MSTPTHQPRRVSVPVRGTPVIFTHASGRVYQGFIHDYSHRSEQLAIDIGINVICVPLSRELEDGNLNCWRLK